MCNLKTTRKSQNFFNPTSFSFILQSRQRSFVVGEWALKKNFCGNWKGIVCCFVVFEIICRKWLMTSDQIRFFLFWNKHFYSSPNTDRLCLMCVNDLYKYICVCWKIYLLENVVFSFSPNVHIVKTRFADGNISTSIKLKNGSVNKILIISLQAFNSTTVKCKKVWQIQSKWNT